MIDDNEGEPLELTSDFATFEQQQSGPEEPKGEQGDGPETGENGTGEVVEPEEQSEEEAKPKGKSVQERIDEITAARREAEREAEFWRQKALGAQKPEEQQDETAGPVKPNPADYEWGDQDPAYQEALVDWKVEVKFAAKDQQHTIETQVAQLEQGYTERLKTAREEIPDYDDVVTKSAARGEWPCPPLVAIAIKESEVGPKVAHHLATNRDEAISLANLSPIEQALAFGRLEARFLNQPKQQPKIATEAPEPQPGRARGASGRFTTSPDTEDFAAFEQMAMQKRG